MGIYALEITLKVAICRRLDLPALPRPFEIHDLESLGVAAGLPRRILAVTRPRAVPQNSQELVTVSRDVDRFRYAIDPSWDRALAEDLRDRLIARPGGVILWLRKKK